MNTATKQRLRDAAWLLGGLCAVTLVALWVASKTEANLLAHSAFDTYAKQAIAWREGHAALGQDYPWLELAIYQGNYYVSFPPVPTIPMWVLSFFMGEQTPSGLMTLLYFLGTFIAFYLLCKRYLHPAQAALLAIFAVLGGSVLDLAVSGHDFSGGVWFQAQLLGMLLTALAFLLTDGKSRAGWAVGLICIALAVGCRPFNALYVPLLLWMLYRKLAKPTFLKSIAAMLPYVIIPALIACAYGYYNWVRFGNPLEFGHAYLPEFTESGEPMFAFSRIWENLKTILQPVEISAGSLYFPVVSGFAVYLTNPMILYGAERGLERTVRRKADSIDLILGITLILHALSLLTHRTNGGWQYGTRYLCDLLPALVFLCCRGDRPIRRWEAALMGALIAFNVYGTVRFHWL